MAISKLHRANSGYSFVRDKKFRSCLFTFDHCYTIFVNFPHYYICFVRFNFFEIKSHDMCVRIHASVYIHDYAYTYAYTVTYSRIVYITRIIFICCIT